MVLPMPVFGRPRPLFSLSGIDPPLNTSYPVIEPEQGWHLAPALTTARLSRRRRMACAYVIRRNAEGLGAAKPRLTSDELAPMRTARLAGRALRRLRSLLMIAVRSFRCSGPHQSGALTGTLSRAARPEAKDGLRSA